MTLRLEVAHHVPGRLRVRARAEGAQVEALTRLVRQLPYVHRVDRRLSTGSVIVEYAPSAFGEFSALLRRSLPGIEVADRSVRKAPVRPAGPYSGLAHALFDALAEVDREIRRATENTLDLRLLFPLGIAAYGLRLGDRLPPPLSLGLFATSLFVALHPTAVGARTE